MNGLELARWLRADFPELKLLMTSGRLPAQVATSLTPFILKPYDVADIVVRIRAALAEPKQE